METKEALKKEEFNAFKAKEIADNWVVKTHIEFFDELIKADARIGFYNCKIDLNLFEIKDEIIEKIMVEYTKKHYDITYYKRHRCFLIDFENPIKKCKGKITIVE